MYSKIEAIEYWLPETVLDNHQLEQEFPGWNSNQIEKKVGIQERHIAGENETASDLAYEAARKLLKNYDKDKIDFLLLCTQSPDYFFPSSSCILQDRLMLSNTIGALDYNLGCSGFIYGLALSKGLIRAGIASHVLLLTAETYSKHIHPKDRANRSIFGDGAAATGVSKADQEHIYEFELGTDGKGKDNLIVANGALRNKNNCDESAIVDETGFLRSDNYLYMNGPEIFNFTIEKVPLLVENTLRKNKMSLNDIHYVIFHQANKYMLTYLRKKMKIPENKFFMNMENTGNTVSATIPIALKESLCQGIVKKGDNVLLVGFGVGYSWGATVVMI